MNRPTQRIRPLRIDPHCAPVRCHLYPAPTTDDGCTVIRESTRSICRLSADTTSSPFGQVRGVEHRSTSVRANSARRACSRPCRALKSCGDLAGPTFVGHDALWMSLRSCLHRGSPRSPAAVKASACDRACRPVSWWATDRMQALCGDQGNVVACARFRCDGHAIPSSSHEGGRSSNRRNRGLRLRRRSPSRFTDVATVLQVP